MLNSAQVAALMQQQQAMFLGMQQYSQTISSQMPQAYGVGQYGMGMAMHPQMPQIPFAPQARPGFSYQDTGTYGYGLGNRMGAGGVAALGGAGQFGLGALGIAGGLGLMGRAGSIAFDPIGAGMAGFTAARGLGFGVGGALGVGGLAAGVVAAPMMMAQHAFGSMVTGAQEQAGVNQVLGQFNFINPASRSGRGFSRHDAMAIGSVTRQLEMVPEMMTSMSELTRIMDKIGQSGMMQGVHDAGQFAQRFKQTVHTLRDISKMMGSSMDEAMQAFQESRQAGFYSPDAIKQNIMQRQITGGLTGMSQQQVGALQAYGAQTSFQMGGSRGGGARSVTRIAGELGMANQMGLLSNDRIVELTGMEGAAGIQELAGSLNVAGQKMGRSSLGTAMTLALGKVENGRYTGEMDQDLVQRVRSGEIGQSELLALAHKKSAGRGAKLSFAAHRQRLTAEMVNATGPQGIAMELKGILGEHGFNNPDALNLVMQHYGMDERQANEVISLAKEMPGIQRGMHAAGVTEARRMAEQSFIRENASWEGLKHKIGTRMSNVLTEPFKKLGAHISDSISESVDSFVDDIFGRYQTKITDLASSTVVKAQMGDVAAKRLVQSATHGLNTGGGGADFRNHSIVGSLMNALAGQRTGGEVQGDILKSMGLMHTVSADHRQGMNTYGVENHLFHPLMYDVVNPKDIPGAIASLKGANPLSGKIDVSKGPGKFAMLALKYQLLTNKDLKGATDSDKWKMITEGLKGIPGIEETLGGLKKSLGTSSDVDVLDALSQAGGLSDQAGMFNRHGLMLGLGGLGSGKDLAKKLSGQLDTASGGLGDMSDVAKSTLAKGGKMAQILSVAFGGGKIGDAVRMALGQNEGSKVDPSVLKALDMTQDQFNALRSQGSALVGAGIKGGASGDAINAVLQTQLQQGYVASKDQQKNLGLRLTEGISEADLGGLSAGGKALVGKIGGLAGGLTSGQGFGDVGDLVQNLADYEGNRKNKDRRSIEKLAGPELQQGVEEVRAVRHAYGKHKKGGVAVDKLIESLGLQGDVASTVRKMAGDDKSVSGAEEKNIEKYLGQLGTVSLTGSGKTGSNQTINAATDKFVAVLDKVNANFQSTLAALKTISGKAPPEGGKSS